MSTAKETPKRPKGGVIKEINDKLAQKKAKKDKPNGKGDDFKEMTPEELAAQEGRTEKRIQADLPGMETPKLPDLIKAAKSYVEARNSRMKMTETEVDRRTLLHGLMNKHQLRYYKFEGLKIELKAGEDKVKVSVETDEDDE